MRLPLWLIWSNKGDNCRLAAASRRARAPSSSCRDFLSLWLTTPQRVIPNILPLQEEGTPALVPLRPGIHRIYPSPLDLVPKTSSSLLHPTSSSFLFILNPPQFEKRHLLSPLVSVAFIFKLSLLSFSGKAFYTCPPTEIISHFLFFLYTPLNRSTFFVPKLITEDAYRRVSRGPCGHRPLGSYCRSGN